MLALKQQHGTSILSAWFGYSYLSLSIGGRYMKEPISGMWNESSKTKRTRLCFRNNGVAGEAFYFRLL
jgi:hypothetical protein